MPTFSVILASEARNQSASTKRTELLQEYIGYIQRVGPGQAGVLTAGAGETTQAVRRRLNAAAAALGTSLDVRRAKNAVYFWGAERRRRGRPRKNRAE